MKFEQQAALQELDRDGAIQEAAAGVDEATRASFMRRTGAFVGGGLALGSIPVALATASGGLPSGDVKILNFALTLEYLEAAFYAEAVSKGALSGSAATFAHVVAQHEAAHVQALMSTLGSAAVKKPKFDFKGTTGKQSSFLSTSMVLEDTGVQAYEGQVGNIKTPAVLMAAGSILPVEARHAAWVRDIIGAGHSPVPAPQAFNPSLTMSAVLSAVKGTGFITG
ncbi:MAG: ferritin-like domain-containing protein [Solirubrobacteraceae bacterium]